VLRKPADGRGVPIVVRRDRGAAEVVGQQQHRGAISMLRCSVAIQFNNNREYLRR
jgi:hypothetical protein